MTSARHNPMVPGIFVCLLVRTPKHGQRFEADSSLERLADRPTGEDQAAY